MLSRLFYARSILTPSLLLPKVRIPSLTSNITLQYYSKQPTQFLSNNNSRHLTKKLNLQTTIRSFRKTVLSKEKESAAKEAVPKQKESNSIFKRFKDAYKQHGKVLIYVHITTCCGWITGLFFLAKSGLDITKVLNLCETLHILSRETIDAILYKINHFVLKNFLHNWYIDYVIPQSWIEQLNLVITGDTLKNAITAVVLYKLCTPFRYLLTLGTTKLVIDLFKRKGIMPVKPPPGDSVKELYKEQKSMIDRRIRIKYQDGRERSRKFFKRNSFAEINKRRKFK